MHRPARLRKRPARRFRALRQHGDADCGSTCLAMIFRHHGLPDLRRSLMRDVARDADGSSLATLADIAGRYGFAANALRLDWDGLPELRLPLLVHYRSSHFVVVYRARHGAVWVADPASGKERLTRESFERRWTGIVLELQPAGEPAPGVAVEPAHADPDPGPAPYRTFYRPVLRSLRGLLLRILLATAALQLLGLALPLFTQRIVDDALVHRDRHLLLLILGGMAAVFVTQVVLLSLRNLMLVRLRMRFEYSFFSRLFGHLLQLRQAYFDRHRREDFIARFQENLSIRQLVNPAVFENLVDLLFVLLYIPVLLWMNVKLGLIACVLVLFYALVTACAAPSVSRMAQRIFLRNMEGLGSVLDALLGIKTIRLLGMRRAAFESWRAGYKAALDELQRDERTAIGLHSAQRGLQLLSQLAIFWIGGYMCFRGEISIGSYLAITSIFMMVLTALFGLSGLWYNFTELWVSIGRLNDVLMQEPEIQESSATGASPDTATVVIRDLFFRYRPTDPQDVLKGLSVSFRRGELIGIVGRNGSGKSTLAQLLLGLYPDYRGEIRFGGTELRDLDPGALRQRVFLFPQELHIFNGTIRDNILCANPQAGEEALLRAVDLAGLRDLVDSLVLGMEHRLGNAGNTLSGGQRLRIGFARLFVASPDVIILDESCSLLDVESERRILMNIRDRFPRATVISIAHRMHTLRNADRIWVIEDGKVVEDGSHDALTEAAGAYAAFMATYLGH